ncbi:MAG TPA: glycine--tRNA ligase [Geobacterales bacterium]|nr:glycine--tRNA ligase [Geobacterales bacterium]
MNNKLIELAKRRGLFWPSFEIYGGMSGFIDFGPIGIKIIDKIEKLWRSHFEKRHDFIFEISTPIVMPEIILKASGHVEHFTDVVLTCSKCGRKYRVDHIIEVEGVEGWSMEEIERYLKEKGMKCPECNGEFEKPYKFNLLMKTNIGPYAGDIGYLRPEAAQGIFINFRRLYELNGKKLPFGVFQIGKVQRNEISPRKGLYRMREFTIIDLEFFYDKENPSCPYIKEIENEKLRILRAENKNNVLELSIRELIRNEIVLTEWLAYFMYLSKEFIRSVGIDYNKQYFLEKAPEERAHYSSQTFDHMVITSDNTPIEVAGFAFRTDYDLRNHSEKSGNQLVAEKVEGGKVIEKFYPYVVEPSFGIERIFLVAIDAAFKEIKNRTILALPKVISPFDAAIATIAAKDELMKVAKEIYKSLKEKSLDVILDTSEYIGKVYARADEIGIPYVITVDYQSLEDKKVTIRDRDTWKQIRVNISELDIIKALIKNEIEFEKAGEIFKN